MEAKELRQELRREIRREIRGVLYLETETNCLLLVNAAMLEVTNLTHALRTLPVGARIEIVIKTGG